MTIGCTRPAPSSKEVKIEPEEIIQQTEQSPMAPLIEETATLSSLAKIDVKSTQTVIPIGDQIQLEAVVIDIEGQERKDIPITWTSTDTEVATILDNGIATGRKPGTTTLIATTDGYSARVQLSVTDPNQPRIALKPSTVTIPIGKTKQLKAFALDAPKQPIENSRLQWLSRNPSVAKVTESGIVRGLTPGKTTIVARAEEGSADATITVVGLTVSKIEINPRVYSLNPCEEKHFSVSAKDGRGQQMKGVRVSWKSTNPKVAKINKNGVVIGINPGFTFIRATAGGVKSNSASVFVRNKQSPRRC